MINTKSHCDRYKDHLDGQLRGLVWFLESHNTFSLSPDNKLNKSKLFLMNYVCFFFWTPCIYIGQSRS